MTNARLQLQYALLKTPAPCVPARHSLIKIKAATAALLQDYPLAPDRVVQCSERHVVTRCSAGGAAESPVHTKLSVSVPTAETRSSLRFQLLPTGTGQAVVVSAVAEGSSAEQAGVQRGMKLTAISDPIRRDDVWELQDRPSLRYIRDVMRMRNADFIELCFESDAELVDALDASEGSISMTNNSSSSSSTPSSNIDSISSLASMGDSGDTVAERLQQQYERAQAAANKPTALEQRQQRRKDYMEQAGQRNDNSFIAIMGAAFLLPAIVILAVAYFSGYLDNLYSNSLTNMR